MSEKNICKHCAWWGVDAKGICDRIAIGEEVQGGPEKLTGAFIECDANDDSGLCAELKTGPDFGCVEFRPKNID